MLSFWLLFVLVDVLILKALLKVLSLSLLIAYPCLGLSYLGAQPWKPQRLVGSAQLSIFQIDAIVLPESASKSLVDSVTDFSKLIQRVSGRSVQVLSDGRPKNAIYFQLTTDLSKGGALRFTASARVSILVAANLLVGQMHFIP